MVMLAMMMVMVAVMAATVMITHGDHDNPFPRRHRRAGVGGGRRCWSYQYSPSTWSAVKSICGEKHRGVRAGTANGFWWEAETASGGCWVTRCRHRWGKAIMGRESNTGLLTTKPQLTAYQILQPPKLSQHHLWSDGSKWEGKRSALNNSGAHTTPYYNSFGSNVNSVLAAVNGFSPFYLTLTFNLPPSTKPSLTPFHSSPSFSTHPSQAPGGKEPSVGKPWMLPVFRSCLYVYRGSLKPGSPQSREFERKNLTQSRYSKIICCKKE